MLQWLSDKVVKWSCPSSAEALSLYQTITAEARNPEFYERFEIADTLDGRFDTLTLLTSLVVRRLVSIGEQGRQRSQELVDVMFADMDLSLHEIGVSENKVGGKVKIMARAFVGRGRSYGAALDKGDKAALALALHRNLYREKSGIDPQKNGLVSVIMTIEKSLGSQDSTHLLKGSLEPFLPRKL